MTAPNNLTLTFQCLCKLHIFSTPISHSDLPLSASACHCTSCRHSSGALCTCDVPWPGDPTIICESSLSRYPFSKTTEILFCRECGSPMFYEQNKDERGEKNYGAFVGRLSVSSLGGNGDGDTAAMVREEGGKVYTAKEHIFVGDTGDGGALGWLEREGRLGEDVKVWMGRQRVSEQISVEEGWLGRWKGNDSVVDGAEGERKVGARCHCGGADFEYDAEKARGEMIEWNSDRGIEGGNLKAKGVVCQCASCRAAAGTDMMPWMVVSLKHIKWRERMETLRCYRSSPGTVRYFCARCSATVLLRDDADKEMVKVAVGLLEAGSGARAEEVVCWGEQKP